MMSGAHFGFRGHRASLNVSRPSRQGPAGRGGAQGAAVVANVGSIVGLFTTPFASAYCSSKAALHSLTDALR